MHEQTLMPDDDHRPSWDWMTRTSAIVIAMCVSPLYFLFSYLGNPGKSTAACCAGVIVTVCMVFWDWRKCAWFWSASSVVLLLHLPLILLVPWTDKSYPGVVILPLGLVDFGFVYGCFALARKTMKGAGDKESLNQIASTTLVTGKDEKV
jgi:hypothetical protein